MRMQERVVVFAMVGLLGFFALALSFGEVSPVLLFFWVGAFFAWVRSLSCYGVLIAASLRFIRPNGWSSPFVGRECAYCGERY